MVLALRVWAVRWMPAFLVVIEDIHNLANAFEGPATFFWAQPLFCGIIHGFVFP